MTSRTEIFRQHHTEVRALSERIGRFLDVAAVTRDATPVAAVVRELFGKFGVHLAIEDATLYPRMLTHRDGVVRDAASRFQAEMGGLKETFDAYRHRWPGPSVISRDPAAFVAETRAILASLDRRIAHEDRHLYDLFDRAS